MLTTCSSLVPSITRNFFSSTGRRMNTTYLKDIFTWPPLQDDIHWPWPRLSCRCKRSSGKDCHYNHHPHPPPHHHDCHHPYHHHQHHPHHHHLPQAHFSHLNVENGKCLAITPDLSPHYWRRLEIFRWPDFTFVNKTYNRIETAFGRTIEAEKCSRSSGANHLLLQGPKPWKHSWGGEKCQINDFGQQRNIKFHQSL